ncbi:YkgJ family cysteine cluster protein [Litoribacter ruber]|uniref:YkgJ family cysteine cluster protein n=2 Tax=Litoribacter ruber TaxID=702568 RepID=A0AAP2CKX9_9BACT|nr:YkgJ family cysteine cluster protein [Litoribacter alkaliphilus]MBT0811632.1 YkgJ family cysteine cluster protein [Litoribacter ruber]
MFHREHENSFREIDCLSCANCCKTTSPIFISTDIERISKTLKMKTGEFIDTYLRMDEEGDYVLQKSPCSFLLDDNTCLIYEDRPKACREYPHTDRKNMTGILALTLRNTLVCPAVLRIFQVFSREFRK